MGNNCCAKRLPLDQQDRGGPFIQSEKACEHDDLEHYRIKSKHNVNDMLEELQ